MAIHLIFDVILDLVSGIGDPTRRLNAPPGIAPKVTETRELSTMARWQSARNSLMRFLAPTELKFKGQCHLDFGHFFGQNSDNIIHVTELPIFVHKMVLLLKEKVIK